MPPIIAATCCPSCRSPSGLASTTPTHSMPSTRGKVTPSARPRRVCSSDRLRPNASILMRTQPGLGSGSGSWRICRLSTGPGALSTTALMLDVIPNRGTTDFSTRAAGVNTGAPRSTVAAGDEQYLQGDIDNGLVDNDHEQSGDQPDQCQPA